MVHFVGAGPGAQDLITLRGAELLKGAGVIIYAGSLVNPALLGLAREDCRIYNSAELTLEQVLDVMKAAQGEGLDTVRLHTCTGPSGSRWTNWTGWAYPGTTRRACPASAGRRRLWGRSTPSPG